LYLLSIEQREKESDNDLPRRIQNHLRNTMTVQPLRSCQLESDQKAFTLNPNQSKPEIKRKEEEKKKE
jgi:hypothetical protein